MDNQHREIRGYRDLSAEDITRMNAIKLLGDNCGSMIDELRKLGLAVDQRWVSIAQTHLQQGFMAAVRSIAQPTTF